MDEKKDKSKREALQELLKFIAEHPELADRIEISLKPSKVLQGDTDKT